MQGVTGAVPAAAVGPSQGVNQIMEVFKMQYLMKFMDQSGSSRGSITMMLVLMAYDQIVKQVPIWVQMLWAAIQLKIYGPPKSTFKNDIVMLQSTPPPPEKTIRAFVQFERSPEKATDPRIDAVIHHVCNLPDVRSLRQNGVEMIPNFKDALMIDNDIWFEIQGGGSASSFTTTIGNNNATGSPVRLEPILQRLSCQDHDITWLHKFVERAMKTYDQEKRNKLGSETQQFDQNVNASLGFGACVFTKSKFQSNRTLDNVQFRQVDDLKERVDFFLRRRDWQDKKGIPHTLGIVMQGHPGCGKTSTIKAIANETKRHIFNIALSSIKTKEGLKNLFQNDEVIVVDNGKNEALNIPLKQRLQVIEDIDAMNSVVIKRSKESLQDEMNAEKRDAEELEKLKKTQDEGTAVRMMKGKTTTSGDELDLATLLNVLDGVRETPGRIIILSTNYPERLDEALLRPGRFDMMLEFEKHSCEVLRQHLERHQDITLSAAQLERINQSSLNHKWTPAEVSQILFGRIASPDAAIHDLVTQTPEKLFKFSQMKKDEKASHGETKEGTKLNELQGIETGSQVVSETASVVSQKSVPPQNILVSMTVSPVEKEPISPETTVDVPPSIEPIESKETAEPSEETDNVNLTIEDLKNNTTTSLDYTKKLSKQIKDDAKTKYTEGNQELYANEDYTGFIREVDVALLKLAQPPSSYNILRFNSKHEREKQKAEKEQEMYMIKIQKQYENGVGMKDSQAEKENNARNNQHTKMLHLEQQDKDELLKNMKDLPMFQPTMPLVNLDSHSIFDMNNLNNQESFDSAGSGKSQLRPVDFAEEITSMFDDQFATTGIEFKGMIPKTHFAPEPVPFESIE